MGRSGANASHCAAVYPTASWSRGWPWPVFPNARYVFGAAEFDFWRRGENVCEARKFNRELFVKIALPLANRSSFVKPGEDIAPGIRTVDAAGHSPGMLAYHIESEGKRLLIWADSCVHYVMAIQRPD